MLESQQLGVLLSASLVLLAGCGGTLPSETAVEATPVAPESGTPDGTMAVHYINVGQSVSTLIVGPTGETMLVDTGHYNDDGEYVLQYLRRQGIDRIDYLVVSHNDADHIGGNAAVIEHFETEADGVGAVYDPGIAASTRTYGRYLDAVEEHDVTLYETREGDTIPFEGVDTTVLGPPEPSLENGARNENSIVLRVSHGETSFLLTGDAEDDQEAYLIEEYGDKLQATVLKAGHHGSASSTSEALLDAVQPRAVVISSAYDSRYGHPDETVLQRLSDRDIPAYWTAIHGDIVLVSNGEDVSVRTQDSGPVYPRSLRTGNRVPPGVDGPVEERTRLCQCATATPAESVAADGGAPTGDAFTIETVHADAAGDDRENLTDEYVVFRNTGTDTLALSGWTVTDAADKTYTFPEGYTLGPGVTVTLHTGRGTGNATHLYWDYGSPVWNNAGDTVTVRNSEGDAVRVETYE